MKIKINRLFWVGTTLWLWVAAQIHFSLVVDIDIELKFIVLFLLTINYFTLMENIFGGMREKVKSVAPIPKAWDLFLS